MIMSDDLNAKIQQRAYAIWERENRPEGRHLEHWHCAQAEIEAEQPSSAGQPDEPTSGQADSIANETAGAAPVGGSRAKKQPR
jgi:hypothetical protein